MFMKKLLLLPLLFLSFAQAETFQCGVVGVTDGDTITCLTDEKKQVKVRLYQIDAPESGQAYGQQAKQLLSDMIYNKHVKIENMGLDRYKHTLGIITAHKFKPCKSAPPDRPQPFGCYDLININLEMIKYGYAWYNPFDGENPEYQQAELEVKAAKRGLWADEHVMSPWEWRKQSK